jgi:ATP-dependent helicase/nuclease subunit B
LTEYHLESVAGGASVLTYQSQCPFKAFATARLAAQDWNPAEPFLTAAQRGQLLHAVLHSIWGGPKTRGIRTLTELRAIRDRQAFIAEHVRRATQSELKQAVRERLPQRYLEMEERRLNFLVGEWLDFELTRVDFTVMETEAERTVKFKKLSSDLRLDRIDQLSDGTLLVIDYKTGLVKTKSWELPRPDDVQLPLYAAFALSEEESLGGLTFAKVRRGDDMGFAGHINDARATLISSLRGTSGLVKNKLDEQKMNDWKREIESLVRNFLAGRADVNPREYPETCTRCGLHALCRIQEHSVLLAVDETAAEEEAADE